jgi:hypothetical protein
MADAAGNEGGVAILAADMGPNSRCDRVFPSGTFLSHLKLFRMTIQQDPHETDPWWFVPLLYAGAAVVIAAFVLA